MALIAELQTDSPVLMDALSRVPGTTVTLEDLYLQEHDTVRGFYWIDGAEFDVIESALDTDDTVDDIELVTDIGRRRLYRIDLSPGVDTTVPVWSSLELTIISARATQDGWTVTIRYPDRDTLRDHIESVRQLGIDYAVVRLYEEDERSAPTETQLTPAQVEALQTAYEAGYFTVPRTGSLETVASALDVSEQAVSERIRRGTAALIESSLRVSS